MESKIIGYHQDEETHWVAELDCGHNQHVRHNPPLENRDWVTTPEGRRQFLGFHLDCLLCDERENGTGGKVLGLFLGSVQKYRGNCIAQNLDQPLTSGKWIDVQLGDDVSVSERIWESAIFKKPAKGSVQIGRLGIEGDQQADKKNHGGPDKAICLYPIEYYPEWEQQIGKPLCQSAFGENITSEGLLERAVCIGDQFSVGTTVLEISQPRQPCWKIATRWGFRTLAKEFLKQTKTGWYFRVLQPGSISHDSFLNLEHRPNPEWTVQRVIRARFEKEKSHDRKLLKDIAELSESWKR